MEDLVEIFKEIGDVQIVKHNERGVYWIGFEGGFDSVIFRGKEIEQLRSFIATRHKEKFSKVVTVKSADRFSAGNGDNKWLY